MTDEKRMREIEKWYMGMPIDRPPRMDIDWLLAENHRLAAVLEEAERKANEADVRANEAEYAAIGSCEGASAEIASIEADRDRWKARAEVLKRVLEKAMHGDCNYCTGKGCKTPSGQHMPCACINGNAWQFDEARFAEGGGELWIGKSFQN